MTISRSGRFAAAPRHSAPDLIERHRASLIAWKGSAQIAACGQCVRISAIHPSCRSTEMAWIPAQRSGPWHRRTLQASCRPSLGRPTPAAPRCGRSPTAGSGDPCGRRPHRCRCRDAAVDTPEIGSAQVVGYTHADGLTHDALHLRKWRPSFGTMGERCPRGATFRGLPATVARGSPSTPAFAVTRMRD